MRKILATLILGVVVAFSAAAAFADGNTGIKPFFYGDGFDNATCVVYTGPHIHCD